MEAHGRPLIACGFALATLLAVIALASPGVDATPGPAGKSGGVFAADCDFSHRLPDDPIVFPRGRGASHMHDFFGSRTTDAYSRPDTIKKTRTTCVRGHAKKKFADASAYWVPTLYNGDREVEPDVLGVYYNTGFRYLRKIEPFPEGLRVIVGDSKGVNPSGYRWWCEGKTLAPGTATIAPTCSRRLILRIRFPDCWDGRNVDSRDHKSHMAFSTQERTRKPTRVCPSTHPRVMPQLEFLIKYPASGPGIRLASGAINTAHADFMNGWEPDEQSMLVRRCLHADKYCGGGDRPAHD